MCGRLKIALRQLCTKGNPDNRIFGSLAKKGVCIVLGLHWGGLEVLKNLCKWTKV